MADYFEEARQTDTTMTITAADTTTETTALVAPSTEGPTIMAYPPGVSLATITIGAGRTMFGAPPKLISATVTPIFVGTPHVVHAASGWAFYPSPQTFRVENGEELTFELPHVDAEGWRDTAGNEFPALLEFGERDRGWAYHAKFTVIGGSGQDAIPHRYEKVFQPLVGQTEPIDVDLVPDGKIGAPVTAPSAVVTSIGGLVGPVSAEQLQALGLGGLGEEDVEALADAAADQAVLDAGTYTDQKVGDVRTEVTQAGYLTEVPDTGVKDLVERSDSSTSAAIRASTVSVLRQREAYHVTQSDLTSGADNRHVLLAAVTAAAADGVRRVVLPRGEITLGAQVTIPSNAHGLRIEGHGEDTVVKQIAGAVNTALFYGAGTDGTKYPLTVDHSAGVTTLTIPTEVASTLTVGSLLGLECTTIVYGAGTGQESRASEIRSVVAVSGTTVTVDGPLLHDYTVAAGGVAWKMTPLRGVSFANFVLTSTDPAAVKARNLYLVKAQDAKFEGIHLLNSGGGIYLNDVMGSVLTDINVDGLPNVSNFLGYGVAVGGRSAHSMIDGIRGRDCRHVFTTLADERAGAVQWGGPRHVTVSNGVGEARKTGTGYAVWDTHPYGTDVVFNNLRAFGGSGASAHGIQIRSKKTKLNNCSAIRPGKTAVRVDPVTAEDVEINGGEYAFASEGVALGRNTRVHGAWIHDNTGVGVQLVSGASASGSHIFGNLIENNTYGLQDISDGTHTGVVVQGNTIPKSSKQSFAFLSPKGNLTYTGNVVRGYGTDPETADGVGGSPAATVKRVNNITD